MATVIRAELYALGLQVVDPDFHNPLVNSYALIMKRHGVAWGWLG